MKTVGIIAELNPFHNGHQYIIEKAKQITKADNVIILCSGNYVQRGAPAIINKYERAKMALKNGADAVFELPVVYATASAELFARASVAFFDRLNCVDYLCFGCEADDMKLLSTVTKILYEEPPTYRQYLSSATESGLSFPKARQYAVIEYCRETGISDPLSVELLLSAPNNILAIEYLKALKYFHSKIQPLAVRRQGAGYHSLETNARFASATAIRREIEQNSYQEINAHIPANCHNALEAADKVFWKDFNLLLGERLIRRNDFSDIFGINEDLSNRIERTKFQYITVSDYLELLHSKNYTYSAVSRALLHLCLGIKQQQVDEFIGNGYHFYARLLGFRKESGILSEIKEKSLIPLISKLSAFYHQCDEPARKMLDLCIGCDHLYRLIVTDKTGRHLPNEFENQIIIQ